MMQTRLPRTKRAPNLLKIKTVSERGLAIISYLDQYKLLSTSLILQLIGGSGAVTHRHLQRLFHLGYVCRFALPRIGQKGEFIYYLDDFQGIELLVKTSYREKSSLDWETPKRHRARGYLSNQNGAPVRLGSMVFIEHELMVSHFHCLVEMKCRASDGKVQLTDWRQGPKLWNWVTTSNDGQIKNLPHRPDAFFTLKTIDEDRIELSHFFYEADRGTMSVPRIIDKLLAHLHFILQKKTLEIYGFKRLRAVLFETTDSKRAEDIRAAINEHPVLRQAGELFWFTVSSAVNEKLFEKIWLPADVEELKSLSD